MRAISEMAVIQIEVTNACHLKCANCTRFVGHHYKPFYMELDMVRKAIDSLEGYPGMIGLMGGEPTMHPKFHEICEIYQEMIPDRKQRHLWTSGLNWEKHKDVIKATFDRERINYNDHTTFDGRHQPLLVASDDVVEDKELMWELINNCWVQSQWSASITPKGAYFCEVAAALDHLFEGPGGYPVEKGWWKRTPDQFQDQVKRSCTRCSGALPLDRPSDGRGGLDGPTVDVVSSGNAERLKLVKSPKFNKGNVTFYDKPYTMDTLVEHKANWHPSHFRSFEAHSPEDKPTK